MSLCVILFCKDIMLEELIKIDQQILLLFNRYHTVYWDQVMWVYTGKYIWIPLILSFVWVYFRKNWKDALWTILMMILVVTVCDQFASTICKPYFARFRPAQDPDFSQFVTIANGYRGGKFGFISSHAANAAGLVTFTSAVGAIFLSSTIFMASSAICAHSSAVVVLLTFSSPRSSKSV